MASTAAPLTGASRAATPAWSAVAAWGAALLQLALGAGVLTAAEQALFARTVGALVLALGAAAFGWGAATLARARVTAPRAGVVGAVAGIATSGGLLVLAPTATSVVAVATTSVLLAVLGAVCGRAMRQDAAPAGPIRMSALLVAAVVVAGVVTPALSATEAGLLAPDHGAHEGWTGGHH